MREGEEQVEDITENGRNTGEDKEGYKRREKGHHTSRRPARDHSTTCRSSSCRLRGCIILNNIYAVSDQQAINKSNEHGRSQDKQYRGCFGVTCCTLG